MTGKNIRVRSQKKERFMSEETTSSKPKSPIDFWRIGGRKIGEAAPVKTEKEIDLTGIGGKCVRRVGDDPVAETGESVKKRDPGDRKP
jgi:hypothetical protein